MDTKTAKKTSRFATHREDASGAEMDRHLADNHDEIEAKLDEARSEIAAGKAAPLEPLADLLRQARRQPRSKSTR
ncbi:MAG: hypothetical protein ACREFW_00350 [Rhizomicrobium sp.]